LGLWTHAAGVEEAITVKAAVGFFTGTGYRDGRLQASMGVKDGIDVSGEQFKVFLRHAVAPVGLLCHYCKKSRIIGQPASQWSLI